MTPQQEAEYSKLYLQYKELLSKNAKSKEAELVKTQLRDQFEKQFTFEKLVLVRTIATKSFEFEEIKKIEEAKVQVKLKEIEKSQSSSGSGLMTSIKGMFGYGKKMTPEEEEDQRRSQVTMKEKLEKEAMDKILSQNQQLLQQINMLKTTGKIDENQLGPEFSELIGTDWA